jgi:hypothetical protein
MLAVVLLMEWHALTVDVLFNIVCVVLFANWI